MMAVITGTLAAVALFGLVGMLWLTAMNHPVPGELWQLESTVVGGLLGYVTMQHQKKEENN